MSGRENSIRNVAITRAVQSLGRHFLHPAELAFNHRRSGEGSSLRHRCQPSLRRFCRRSVDGDIIKDESGDNDWELACREKELQIASLTLCRHNCGGGSG